MDQPELYSTSNRITHRATSSLLEKYKKFLKWKENETIMEFGIGDGRNSEKSLYPMLPGDLKEYVASDVSRKFLEYIKGNALHPRMTFLLLDIGTNDLPRDLQQKYDHIFSFFCLHWIKDTRQAFNNIFKMLKPGGQIFLLTLHQTLMDGSLDVLSKNPRWAKYGHEKFLSPYYAEPNALREYENALIDAGFTDRLCVLENMTYEHSSAETYRNFLLSVNPIVNQIPTEDLENYKQDYIEATLVGSVNSVVKCEKTGQRLYRSDYNLIVMVASKPIEEQI